MGFDTTAQVLTNFILWSDLQACLTVFIFDFKLCPWGNGGQGRQSDFSKTLIFSKISVPYPLPKPFPHRDNTLVDALCLNVVAVEIFLGNHDFIKQLITYAGFSR